MTLLVNIPAISIMDQVLLTTEPNIFDKIYYFQVLPLTTYSDHFQIIANLDVKPLNPTNVSKTAMPKPQAILNGTRKNKFLFEFPLFYKSSNNF